METIIETWRLIFSRKTSLLLAEIVFLASEKQFFPFDRTVFPSSGNVFLTNSSFRLVETGFLSRRKSIFLFRGLRNVFLNESSNPYGGDAFFVLWKPFSLI